MEVLQVSTDGCSPDARHLSCAREQGLGQFGSVGQAAMTTEGRILLARKRWDGPPWSHSRPQRLE